MKEVLQLTELRAEAQAVEAAAPTALQAVQAEAVELIALRAEVQAQEVAELTVHQAEAQAVALTAPRAEAQAQVPEAVVHSLLQAVALHPQQEAMVEADAAPAPVEEDNI